MLPVVKILGKWFPNPCSSHTGVNFKLVCRTAWRTARHPGIILHMLKRLLFEIKERNKKSPNQQIFTIEETETHESNPEFHYNRKLFSAPFLYFSLLFTVAIWPRYFYLDSIGVDPFDVNFVLLFLFYFLFFLPSIGGSIFVPISNHLSEEEIVSFLTSSPECVCCIHVSCYHREGSGDDATTVTTFSTDVPVPITRWTDKGKINNTFITSGIHDLLSQTGFIHLDLAIEASAVDSDTKQNLKKIKEKITEEHRHRDAQISTNINYSMTRDGRKLNSFIIFKQGMDVPNLWLSNKEFVGFVVLMVIGLPILAAILLLWKLKTWKITFKKKINYY